MTSATGETAAIARLGVESGRTLVPARSRDGARRIEGFTLIEILVVMAILLSLAAILVVSVGPSVLERGPTRATQALLRRLVLHLDEYREKTGHYPPDGIDYPVRHEETGVMLRGSASLYYHLTRPIEVTRMVAGVPRRVKIEPVVEKFPEADLTGESEEYPGVREIKDRFGHPIHYDNTEDGRFRPQGGEVHYPPLDDTEHPPDPRTLPKEEGGVDKPNQVQSVGFDLWSHGPAGHDPVAPPTPIASWNLRE